MAFDYDLVVIGSTQEGIYAAYKAVLLQARVALVTQTADDYLDPSGFLPGLCLSRFVNYLAHQENQTWGLLDNLASENQPELPSLAQIIQESQVVQDSIQAVTSLEKLAFAGVDVIYGQGEFCRLPRQAFLVCDRQLVSRNYLLATGASYVLPKAVTTISNPVEPEDLKTASPHLLTPKQLWQDRENSLDRNILLMGNGPRSIELTQILARLGHRVTYTTANKKILPGESAAVNRLFAAQLNSDGVKILVNAPLEKIVTIENKVLLQLGERELEAETVVFAHLLQPNIQDLNLQGIGVKSLDRGIIVNEKLQTSNPAVYACGDLLGGNSAPHLTQHEVDIVLKNMLAFAWFKRSYQQIPIAMFTQPNLARIGLTQPPTKSYKKKQIYTVKEYYQSLTSAQIAGATTGWCELIVKANGEILGATIIGDRAVELINLIALIIQHKIKLSANPIRGLLAQDIPYIAPSYGEIFNKLAISFQQAKLQQNKSLRNRLVTWFDWRK